MKSEARWGLEGFLVAGLVFAACTLMADGWRAYVASVLILTAIDMSKR